jgi:serine/threonine protein kinase
LYASIDKNRENKQTIFIDMEKYRIVRKLSESRNSRINLAEALTLPNRPLVVLKEHFPIADVATRRRTDCNQILNESNILGTLSHPNILRLLDSFVDSYTGHRFLVTEYCEGGDLSQATGLTAGEIQEILIQLLLAMKYLHDKQIIHRDLKLKNIFIASRNGGVLRIKIGDFGIARKLEDSVQMATTMVGTPFYLSPEVCARRPYDKSVDVWSLGCVIYELLSATRQSPFNSAKNLQDLMGRIQEDAIDFAGIRDLRVVDMLERMLCKDPNERINVDGLLQLPLIQEYIQDFVTKINSLGNKTVPIQQDRTIPSSPLSNTTADLLDTIQTLLVHPPPNEIEFKKQIVQAAEYCRFVTTNHRNGSSHLEREIECVKQRLSDHFILPSRIQQFATAIKLGDYESVCGLFFGDEGQMKHLLASGLIGDYLVMLEIEKSIKRPWAGN